jgi:hypothetical protein
MVGPWGLEPQTSTVARTSEKGFLLWQSDPAHEFFKARIGTQRIPECFDVETYKTNEPFLARFVKPSSHPEVSNEYVHQRFLSHLGTSHPDQSGQRTPKRAISSRRTARAMQFS